MKRHFLPCVPVALFGLAFGACTKEKPPSSFFDVPVVPKDAQTIDTGDSGVADVQGSDIAPVDAPPADVPPGADVVRMDVPVATDVQPGTDVTITPSDTPHVDTVRQLAPLSGSYSRNRRPTFRWAPFSGVSRFRVEISTDRSFSTVESSFTVDGTSGAPTAELPQGLRYWRVVPSPMGGMDGAPSYPWALYVGRAANDMNGDGFSDIAIAAPGNNAPGSHAGQVYIHVGGGAMDTNADSTLSGEASNNYFGSSLSMSGDINGDGFADLVVGAPFVAMPGPDAGRVYIYFGGVTLPTRPSVVLNAPGENSKFGTSVAIVGDVNGDGYADVAVGAPNINGTGVLSGRAFLFYGGSTFDTTADVTFTFAAPGDQLGRSIAGASDVNGDGLADVLVGAPRNDAGGSTDSGQGYVFFGGTPMDPNPDMTLAGSMMDELSASSLAGLGDYNGDGYGDVIVGSPGNRSTGTMGGAAFVYYGGAAPDSRADITLRGTGLENFGRSVAGAGDVNHDGFTDILVGAPFNPAMGMNTGQVYLFVGSATPVASPAVSFTNAIGGDELGTSVAGAGDTNGDDFDDVLVGAHLAPFSGRGGPGSAYLYGGASSVSPTPRLTFRGVAGDDFGAAVALRFRLPVRFGG